MRAPADTRAGAGPSRRLFVLTIPKSRSKSMPGESFVVLRRTSDVRTHLRLILLGVEKLGPRNFWGLAGKAREWWVSGSFGLV